MFDDYFKGLFAGRVVSLDAQDKEVIQKIMSCTTAKELEAYQEEYEDISTIEFDEESPEHDLKEVEALTMHWNRLQLKAQGLSASDTKNNAIENYINATSTVASHKFNTNVEEMRFFPERFNKRIPKKGCWILVIDDIPTHIKPVQYSVYYAKQANIKKKIPKPYEASGYYTVDYHKCRIMTGEGEVHLWPHEYTKVPIDVILEEVGNSFDRVELGGNTNYDFTKLHYLACRGVKAADSYKLLLNSVNSMDHVFFKIRDEAIEFWDFYVFALGKGIRPEMALRLWEHQESGKPMFNVTIEEDENTN